MERGNHSVHKAQQAGQIEDSAYLLGLPSSRPRLGTWGVVAVVAGAILAVAIVLFESYVASMF
jgi:hypothetical protein